MIFDLTEKDFDKIQEYLSTGAFFIQNDFIDCSVKVECDTCYFKVNCVILGKNSGDYKEFKKILKERYMEWFI